jgi:TetR/AcrR family transcriptional regulator, cholesterol catabolism regulator
MRNGQSTGRRAVGRREQKKEAKLRRIRRAAAELFTEKGYEGATTREIAERADIGAGTLFLYVSDKRALLDLVFEESLADALTAPWPAARDGGLAGRLYAVFERLFAAYGTDVALARHFVREQVLGDRPAPGARLEALRRDLFARIARDVAAEQARGVIAADVDPMLAASNLFGLYFAALVGWLGGFLSKDQALAMLRASLELQQRGLDARPGRG